MTLFTSENLDPVHGLFHLQSELDRFFHRPTGLDLGPSAVGVAPPVNVFRDKEGNLIVRAELPGVAPSDIDIAVENRVLTISGERKVPESPEGSHHRRECRFGKFSRSVQLPDDLNTQEAAAECKNGLLTVTIPKLAETKPRQVKVVAA